MAASNVDSTMQAPCVSVVLPVRNEERYIGRLLQEILTQERPDGGFEVIVVDGRSTDKTRDVVNELCRTWTNLHLVDNPRRLSSAARNIGARFARGKYVMFLDGHCSVPRRDYLVRLVDIFESTGAACLCRPQPLKNLANERWARATAVARHSRLGHNLGSDIYCVTSGFTDPRSAGAAYVRKHIEELGGFDERFDACEDVEFNHRVALAGLSSYRHPDLAIFYEPRKTLKTLFRQMARYGLGRARLMACHRVVPWPLFSLTMAALAAILLATLGHWQLVAIGTGGAAAVGLTIFSVEALRVGGVTKDAWRIVVAFFVIYSGLLVGFWHGLTKFPSFVSAPSGMSEP